MLAGWSARAGGEGLKSLRGSCQPGAAAVTEPGLGGLASGAWLSAREACAQQADSRWTGPWLERSECPEQSVGPPS